MMELLDLKFLTQITTHEGCELFFSGWTETVVPFSSVFFIDFTYLFLERGGGREKERERNISVWLPLT